MNNFDIIQFDSIDSTNTYGVKNFDKLKDKTAVSALVQTQGKGRFNRVWICETPDNLCLSLVLKPEKIAHIANLTQYMSVCTCKVIETYGLKPQIKYPNDVLIDGKKVCGILCESVLKKNIIQGVVLGIGVNLNMPLSLVEKIEKPATSLNLLTGHSIDRQEFLEKLLKEFFSKYQDVIERGFCSFEQEYLKRNNFLGKTVYIQQRDNTPKEQYKAIAMDKNGNLVVRTNEGNQKTIFSGDLSI